MSLINRSIVLRMICISLIVTLFMTTLPAVSLSAGAYSEVLDLPALTGDKARDVVNVALSQVGYCENANSGTAYGAWWTSEIGGSYNYTYSGWCAMFACWCANKAGVGMGIGYDSQSAKPDSLFSWLRQSGWSDTTYSTAPRTGDFIFFGYGSTADHVAVVVEYDSATNIVTFVGGNQGNAVTVSTIEWSTRGRYGDQIIVGYARPNYGAEVSVPAKPSVSTDRSVYIAGVDVQVAWKNVAGSACYQVEVFCDGELMERNTILDLPGYTIDAVRAGEYTVKVSARNCAGSSNVDVCSFVVIESVPNVPVWLTDSTVEAAEINAKLQTIRQGILHYATWYSKTEWYMYFQSIT